MDVQPSGPYTYIYMQKDSNKCMIIFLFIKWTDSVPLVPKFLIQLLHCLLNCTFRIILVYYSKKDVDSL